MRMTRDALPFPPRIAQAVRHHPRRRRASARQVAPAMRPRTCVAVAANVYTAIIFRRLHCACLDAGDVSGLHSILHKSPWHVPALLSLAEVHFFSRANDETGQDLVLHSSHPGRCVTDICPQVERAMLALDAAAHPHFWRGGGGSAMLGTEGQGTGAVYFHAIMRHM